MADRFLSNVIARAKRQAERGIMSRLRTDLNTASRTLVLQKETITAADQELDSLAVQLATAQQALSNETTARNNAITAMTNAESAARIYADGQEAQARIAADNILQAAIDGKPRKFAADFGNGVLTSFTFNHNFNTKDVIVQIYANSNGALLTPLSASRTVNSVTITFLAAVAANANRVVIVG